MRRPKGATTVSDAKFHPSLAQSQRIQLRRVDGFPAAQRQLVDRADNSGRAMSLHLSSNPPRILCTNNDNSVQTMSFRKPQGRTNLRTAIGIDERRHLALKQRTHAFPA